MDKSFFLNNSDRRRKSNLWVKFIPFSKATRIETRLEFFCSFPYSPHDIRIAKSVIRLLKRGDWLCHIQRCKIIYNFIEQSEASAPPS